MTRRWPAGLRCLVLLGVVAGSVADSVAGAVAAAPVVAPAIGGACSPAGDGSMAAVGADLVLRDAEGRLLARWPLRNAQGQAGTLLAVCALPQRHSHAIVVHGWQELWEISHDPDAAPIFDGMVHDYRLGEGIARPGYLGIRRIRLERPWVAVFSDGRQPWLVGAEAGDDGQLTAVVLNLDIRRVLERLPLAPGGGWPALAGRRWP